MKKILFFILISISAFTQQKQLRFEDFTYEPNIKTVLLYPNYSAANGASKSLNPSVVRLGELMTLEFDDLNATYEQFRVRIIHCDYDWKQSVLSEIEFMPEYNDFIINDYQVSQSTKIPYYHYKFELPLVKLSGNYLLVVSKGRNKNDLILTRRFIVYENLVGAGGTVRQAQDPSKWKTHQQVDLGVNFGNYQVMNAREEFKIVVRQNYRWDKTVKNLKPYTINEGARSIEFRFFNNENLFLGGNEYRFFDSRNTNNRGLFIEKIQRGKEDDMWVSTQKDRSEFAYTQQADFDGMYVIDNMDTHRGDTEADYIFMTFGLKTNELPDNQQVYVNGAFNDWRLDKMNLMEYDNDFGGYVATIQLKQGVYNYDFVIKNLISNALDESYYEGNFGETQNTYEVIVYHKPPIARAERVVGYQVLDFNKRR